MSYLYKFAHHPHLENSSGAYSRKKEHACNFQKKGIKGQRRSIFENFGKIVQNLKIFWKRAASCLRILHA